VALQIRNRNQRETAKRMKSGDGKKLPHSKAMEWHDILDNKAKSNLVLPKSIIAFCDL